MDRKDRLEKKCLGTKLQKESCDHDVLGLSRRVLTTCAFSPRTRIAKDSVDAVPASCACGALLRTKFGACVREPHRLPFFVCTFEGTISYEGTYLRSKPCLLALISRQAASTRFGKFLTMYKVSHSPGLVYQTSRSIRSLHTLSPFFFK